LAEHDETLARVIETLKEPVTLDAGLDRRVMAAIEAESVHPAPRSWLDRRWTIRLSPLGGLAVAAGLAGLVFLGTLVRPATRTIVPVELTVQAAAAGREATQFVLIAPGAKTVALVGDFNDWNVSATQLARQAGDGVWWVTVPLAPGRYRYAFVVDGTKWERDPSAPGAEDEFGRPNSVVTIGGV
jgi:hypothetical protein